mmetsp:Transcript_40449/g.103592  ORF Transcript_40449/g.103592 Transcript_40449/m.103592 type:complete len:248 (+) Transcript_40449:13-756(+)
MVTKDGQVPMEARPRTPLHQSPFKDVFHTTDHRSTLMQGSRKDRSRQHLKSRHATALLTCVPMRAPPSPSAQLERPELVDGAAADGAGGRLGLQRRRARQAAVGVAARQHGGHARLALEAHHAHIAVVRREAVVGVPDGSAAGAGGAGGREWRERGGRPLRPAQVVRRHLAQRRAGAVEPPAQRRGRLVPSSAEAGARLQPRQQRRVLRGLKVLFAGQLEAPGGGGPRRGRRPRLGLPRRQHLVAAV